MKLRDIKIYFKMFFHYRPKTFWNEMLSTSFDLRGVGSRGRGGAGAGCWRAGDRHRWFAAGFFDREYTAQQRNRGQQQAHSWADD